MTSQLPRLSLKSADGAGRSSVCVVFALFLGGGIVIAGDGGCSTRGKGDQAKSRSKGVDMLTKRERKVKKAGGEGG